MEKLNKIHIHVYLIRMITILTRINVLTQSRLDGCTTPVQTYSCNKY
jgi:hypothetical protein